MVLATRQPPANQIFVSMKVFAGKNPFGNSHPTTSTVKIIQGGRPSRPAEPTLTDDVWKLVKWCWSQEPQSRPEMGAVLQDLVLSLLQSLHRFTKSLPEFQVALSQFYDSTERKSYLRRMNATELKRFIAFLHDVRKIFLVFPISTPVVTFFRYCGLRD